MSLFCIVWSKNSHRTCISVCTSALSEQFCRVCAEARYEGFEHTQAHAHMHAHKICLSLSETYTCCPSPFSFLKHTHSQMLTHRNTDVASFGHIFSLLCQGVLADLPHFECTYTAPVGVYMPASVCVCLQRKHKCAYMIT